MNRLSVVLAFALMAVVPAAAQSIGEPLPGRKSDWKTPPAARQQQSARPCPEYGPGFVRVEGASACVRASGAVRAEYGRSSDNRSGSSVGGVAQLETRGQSEFGPVRTVVRGRFERSTGDGLYR